jgi:undecaprenyl-diphosphatase
MNPDVLSSQSNFIVAVMADVVIWMMFLGLLLLWLIDGLIKKEQALHAFISALFTWTVTQMIKSFYPSLRPFEVNGISPMTLSVPLDGSFPSTHTAVAFALAFAVYLHNRKTGIIFLLGAIIVALGRVLSNVHFAVDIAAGAIIGVAIAYLLEKMHVTKLLKKV